MYKSALSRTASGPLLRATSPSAVISLERSVGAGGMLPLKNACSRGYSLEKDSRPVSGEGARPLSLWSLECRNELLAEARCDSDSGERFINEPTEVLVGELAGMIYHRRDLRNDEAVQREFAEFKSVCRRTPAIVPYVAERLDPTSPSPGLARKQIEVLMAAIIFRVSTRDSASARITTDLAAIGRYEEAAVFNENTREKIGDRTSRPHSLQLFDNVRILGEALDLRYLTPASYHLARQLCRLREQRADVDIGNRHGDFERLREELRNKILPAYTQKDFEQAVYFCNLLPDGVGHYHNAVMRVTQGRDEYDQRRPISFDPYNLRQLTTATLELLTDEASSSDPSVGGCRSFTGAWRKVVCSYLGYIGAGAQHPLREQATSWIRSHSDVAVEQATGRERIGNSKRLQDHGRIALSLLSGVSPKVFQETLRSVTGLGNLQHQFWNDIVECMAECERPEEFPIPPILV